MNSLSRSTRMSSLLATVSFFLISADVLAAPQLTKLCNSTDEYFNSSSNSCSTCTNCTTLGLGTYSPCSVSNDTICSCLSNQYFDPVTKLCQNCTNCINIKQKTISQCTATTDAVCEPCQQHHFFSEYHKRCTLNCNSCPNGCENGIEKCKCSSCQTGLLCQDILPSCLTSGTTPPTIGTTRTIPTDSDSFSSVSSALIAVGAVLGIIIFSACFVVLGVATSCRKSSVQTDTTSDSSNNSADMNGRTSASLASLYANGQSPIAYGYRTSLDILKYSNGSLNGSWDTLKGSPKSGRSHSAPLSSVRHNRYRDDVWTPV